MPSRNRSRTKRWLGDAAGLVSACIGGQVFAQGQLVGWGSTPPPTQASVAGVSKLAAGMNLSVALRRDGSLSAWGMNEWGQLNVPVGSGVGSQIAAGNDFGLLLNSDGMVVCWVITAKVNVACQRTCPMS